jgi:acyl-coenzyme A thioesterase PaaI-like protein
MCSRFPAVTGPPSRSYPDAATFATPARVRLAASVRDLLDAVLTAVDAPDADLESAAAATDGLAAALRAAARAAASDGRANPVAFPGPRRHGDFIPRSPFVGAANPASPPFEYELRDGRLHARGVFTAAFEGPPGYVHGGWVALAFDEALGLANVASGRGGLTGRLTVRYRRPTPLYRELRLEAYTASVDGRRLTTRGSLFDGDTLLAESEGLFVGLGAEQALEYFGERTAPPEPVDPLP